MIYLSNIPFYQDILHRSLSAMYYMCHCSNGLCDTHKLTSNISDFNYTVVMMVQVKPSVFVSKLWLLNICCLLYL